MTAPATWLTTHERLLPRQGDALDVACGSGRHALWLAERGLRTLAVDRQADNVQAVNDEALKRALPLRAEVVDLETADFSFGQSLFDVIVVVHYLHRPLFPAIVEALRPGGVLVYETFTRAQAARGKPTNPAFLLESDELPDLIHPLEVLVSREGDFDGKMIASVIAQRLRP